MAILTTSSGPANSIRTLYAADYMEAAGYARRYDQLAVPMARYGVERAARLGNTFQVNFLQDIPPGTSVIPEDADVTPSTIGDATATLSPTSRWVALQWSEHLDLDVYTNLSAERYRKVGKAMAETIDVLARDAALQGSFVLRATPRATLDAGTTGDRWGEERLEEVNVYLQSLKCVPFTMNGRPQWVAIAHPAIYYDLRTGGNINSVALYQRDEIILNYELGQLGPFKLVINPDAKVFVGQGVANGSAVATTTAAAISALDKTFTITSTTNIDAGDWLNIIDTAETSNTHCTTNERVKYVSNASSVVTIIGEGTNGGFRFAHASGATVTNNDSVYPVAYGGPMSLAKVFDAETGEFGEIVGPKVSGMLNQFTSLGGKFYGGYGRLVESWLVRGEYTSSLEA